MINFFVGLRVAMLVLSISYYIKMSCHYLIFITAKKKKKKNKAKFDNLATNILFLKKYNHLRIFLMLEFPSQFRDFLVLLKR